MNIENRETFFARLCPYLSPSDFSLVKLAYFMAKYSHRWQLRKQVDENGDPIRYFEHLRGVAIIMVDEGMCVRPEMLIAALMHDSLEDTRDVTVADLEVWFGPTHGRDVAVIVRALSKEPKEGYIERLRMTQDWRILFTKACDRLQNLRSLEDTDRAFQRKQGDETRRHYLPLFEKMVAMVPPLRRYQAVEIRDKIEALTEQYETRTNEE